MNELSLVQHIAVGFLPLLFAITVHEVAHGWMAKQFGDQTAFRQGRLTLNPIKHIDLIGTIIIPGLLLIFNTGFIFGWAKPVPVDGRNFKNPSLAIAIVALAGPVSNILMALCWVLLIRIGLALNDFEFISLPLIYTGIEGIHLNLVFAIINLLPIPPLDGSRVVFWLLPSKIAFQYNRLERFGFVILLLLLSNNVLAPVLAYPIFYAEQLLASLAGL